MVSMYTDEARLKRYSVLHAKMEKCEFWFGKCLLISIVVSLAESVGNIFAKPVANLVQGKLVPNSISTLLVVLTMGFTVFAITQRNRKLILAALVAVVLCFCAGWYTQFQIGAIQIMPLSIALRYAFTWNMLENEEGFPRFQIDWEEHGNREKSQVSYIERRALESGARVEQEALDPNAQMTDIIDAPEEVQQLGAKLHNYHERSRNSDAAVQIAPHHNQTMDAIEDDPRLEEF